MEPKVEVLISRLRQLDGPALRRAAAGIEAQSDEVQWVRATVAIERALRRERRSVEAAGAARAAGSFGPPGSKQRTTGRSPAASPRSGRPATLLPWARATMDYPREGRSNQILPSAGHLVRLRIWAVGNRGCRS